MRDISNNLLGDGIKSLSPVVTAQERINVFYELRDDGDKNTLILRTSPGLTIFTTLPQKPVRGMLTVGNYLYVVADNGLYQIGQTGNYTFLGQLPGIAAGQISPCVLVNNPFQLVIIDGNNGGFVYLFSDLTTAISVSALSLINQMQDVIYLGTTYATQTGNTATSITVPSAPSSNLANTVHPPIVIRPTGPRTPPSFNIP